MRARNISSWNAGDKADQMPGTVRERIEVRSNFTCSKHQRPVIIATLEGETCFHRGEEGGRRKTSTTDTFPFTRFSGCLERPLRIIDSP